MARIVVVDDNAFITRVLAGFLRDNGHDVVATGYDGTDGVALYKEHRPDLVLLDITMPEKDGRDCLREIIEEDSAARVLMVSGLTQPQIKAECLDAGAKGYVDKPLRLFDEDFCVEFRETIEKVLGG